MAYIDGIDKGPVLDLTDDNSLMEYFRKWKKKVEIVFWGPLSATNDGGKCNFIIYCQGKLQWNLLTNGKMKEKSQMPT